MATLLFTAIGTIVGGPLGGAIGALAGRQVDAMIFAPGPREGPRLNELAVTTSSYGIAVPRQFGRMRVAGQIIWATDLVERREKRGGGKGKPSTVTYSYSASFAVALSSRPVQQIGRVWADGKLLRGAGGDLKVAGTFRFHPGSGDQAPDPLIAAAEGAERCPAFRGVAYAVFEDLDLSEYGNRIPALTFEVMADTGTLTMADLLDGVVADTDAAVPLPVLTGLTVEGSPAEILAALDPFFPVDCDACDTLLALRPERGQAAPIALPEAATSDDAEDFGGNAGFASKRARDTDQPVAILRYYDVDRDYQPGAQRAAGRPLPGQPRSVDLPAALDAAAARGLIDQAALRAQWARHSIAWRTTQLDPAVRPGALVTLPDHPGLWRVQEWEWRKSGVDLLLVRRMPDLSGPASAADSGRANPAPDLAAATTLLAACELPWDGNPATPVPLLLAVASSASPNWGGASLFVDQGDGALLPLGPSGRDRATIGLALDVLPPANPLLFDRTSRVTVELAGPDLDLAPATQRQLAMGVNRALLGAELIQFAQARALGSGRWELSGLWRGRGGTEAAVSGHAAGERFILLDGSDQPLDPDLVGLTPHTAIAAVGLGDPAPVIAEIALRGIGVAPPAPVHADWQAAPDGGAILRWVRRARGAWQWDNAAETPLNEQRELYEVTFGPPASPLRRWEVVTPTLALSAADLASLQSLDSAGLLYIRQRGDRGTSPPLVTTLP